MKYIACFLNRDNGTTKMFGTLYIYHTKLNNIFGYRFILDSGADNMHIIGDSNFLSSLDVMDLDERKHDIKEMERVELFHLKNKFVKTNMGSSIGVGIGYRGYLRSVQIDGLVFINVKCTFIIQPNQKIILFPFNMLSGNKILIDEKFNMLVEAKERVILSKYVNRERFISYQKLNVDSKQELVDYNTLVSEMYKVENYKDGVQVVSDQG